MKIAVCDDKQGELYQIRDYLWQYDETLSATSFSSARDLLEAFQADFYDLVFLDIEMEAINGYDAAVRLQQGPDKPLIVFITNSSEYTLRGYGVAFRYLPKPVSYETFSEVTTLALEQLSPQKLQIVADGMTHLLSIRSILYFEVVKHYVHILTSDQEYEIRNNMTAIEQQMPPGRFARPHNSFLVNLGAVDRVGPTDVILINGIKVPLSKRYKKAFDQALSQYIRRS